MTKISLQNLGKRYNREWIFRNLSYDFFSGKSYAITGPNGSGKSTLLQVIGGALMHNEGTISYSDPTREQADGSSPGVPYQRISIAAPYLELIEEMTANEMLSFHSQFKSFTRSENEILEAVGLSDASRKQIRYFSSGMKQRLKLAQAFFSDTPILLLDEPTTNLDEDGIALYHQLVADHTIDRLVLVSSNDKQEYGFCGDTIDIAMYK
ncbi:MAG TPA: ABC transporter ATP-binding protein [Ferruginibacter sp.]|nr:ABC transporter ATP-binding protein [Ferruginibacter sp.]